MTAADVTTIYYLHPLLAGAMDGWPRHFERSAKLGFRHVLIAPPFLPGRSGDIFLTADHRRLHPQIDRSDALDALAAMAGMAGMAREQGLGLMLDLVVDRVAAESPLANDDSAYRHAENPNMPPDPRLPPSSKFTAALRCDAADEVILEWWKARIDEWLDAGICGFRCDAPQRVPAWFWKKLIPGVRERHPGTSFIAWMPGISADAMRSLAPCGFDLATSSSWAWDLRADWLEDETRRVTAVGQLLTMPELPFGDRLAATDHDPEAACRRALEFAAAFGEAWLMPMGFEFGARVPLDPARGKPEDFDILMDRPRFDLCAAVAEANRRRRALTPAGSRQVVSTPHAPVAAILRDPPAPEQTQRGHLLLVNTALDQAVGVDVAPLLADIGGVIGPSDGGAAALAPGEVRVVSLETTPPVLLPDDETRAVAAATRAPRIAIESVSPAVEAGRFAVKRGVGDSVEVAADIICDGHDTLGAHLLWRPADETSWNEVPMAPSGNDRWSAAFPLLRTGRHLFAIEAWIDVFAGYREELTKKHAAGLSLDLELREGCALVARAARQSKVPDLRAIARQLERTEGEQRLALLLAEKTARLMTGTHSRAFHLRHASSFPVDAERKAASFASWYEMFPRSQSPTPGRHGSFDDVIARLPAIRDMGFDVLYFPPIHPIGVTNRKGRNNALRAEPGDPGSPYAIGSPEGGHDAIAPELGTLADFRRLCAAAARHDMEIALDFAIQCSPDHPWLRDHPEWFTWRPDGSIRYAENPPKKYEDIVNVDFYAKAALPSLWLALRDIVRFWVDQGVRIFRVDNPHTKPLPFWEWLIADIRGRHPDVIFLAEAFTRPKMMYRLAKIGFSQSYTYFTWRNTAREIRDYLTELTADGPSAFFRPHFFVNTPDINPFFLQESGRPGFLLRAALAATLSGLWGLYNGFELCEAQALDGLEEYRDSEKFQLRRWDPNRPGNIVAEIRQLNHIRRANPALHSHLGLRFLAGSNEQLLCYVKESARRDNVLLIAASFDMHAVQEGEVALPAPESLGLAGHDTFVVEDLMHGQTEVWRTGTHRLRLDPADLPFAIWRVRTGAAR